MLQCKRVVNGESSPGPELCVCSFGLGDTTTGPTWVPAWLHNVCGSCAPLRAVIALHLKPDVKQAKNALVT